MGYLILLIILLYFSFSSFFSFLSDPIQASVFMSLFVPLFIYLILKYRRTQRIKRANFLSRESLYSSYDHFQFEEVVAEIFRHFDYDAIVTQKSADRGIDVILTKENIKIGVQCKQYKNAVGPGAIRDFVGSLNIQRMNSGYFVTTSRYTKQAIQEAEESAYHLILVDGRKLSAWHTKAKKLVNTNLITAKWWSGFSRKERVLLLFLLFIFIGLFSGGTTLILTTI